MSIQSIGQPLHATAVTSHAHGEVQSPSGQNKVHHNLASHYTSIGLGSRIQPGKVLNTSLKWLTLSAPARKIGIAIQGGHDSHAQSVKGKARYWTGALIKGLANITGG
ncbi:TPA: phospholipase, partial [Aeromonas hydrophila]|nr:phospholipase [Aeromonas hydrophila]